VKEIWKSVNTGRSYQQEKSAMFFLIHEVVVEAEVTEFCIINFMQNDNHDVTYWCHVFYVRSFNVDYRLQIHIVRTIKLCYDWCIIIQCALRNRR